MQEEWERGNVRSLEVRRRKALDRARALVPAFAAIRQDLAAEGLKPTLDRIAERLMARGVLTPHGRDQWHRTTVQRIQAIETEQAKTANMVLTWEKRIADFFLNVPGRIPEAELPRIERLWREAQHRYETTLAEAREVGRLLRGEAYE